MKGYLSGVALMLLSTCATATQLEIKNIDYKYPNSTENQYRLPWLTSGDNPKVAKRINDYLFATLLNQLPGNDPQATLNQLADAGFDKTGTASLNYTIEYRNDKILTINIFAEGCGAYCESYNIPLSFDLTSGANISIHDVISPKNIPQLNDRIRRDIRAQIDTFIAQQKALPVEEQRIEDDQPLDYADFYSTCYTSTQKGWDYADRFAIKDNKLVFLNGRCSNHANRALDDLGDFTTTFPASAVKETLTPYGESLMSPATIHPLSPAPELSGKLLYGTLGKSMRIVMNVTCSGSYIRGAYFYEKYGSPIELTGECSTGNNQHYELTTASQEAAKETFTLDVKNGHYQGVWKSKDKTLPVRFE